MPRGSFVENPQAALGACDEFAGEERVFAVGAEAAIEAAEAAVGAESSPAKPEHADGRKTGCGP